MFYETFIKLCQNKGVRPSRAAIEAGISKSVVSHWKHNPEEIPSPIVLRKLSVYFDVPLSVLLSAYTPIPEPENLSGYTEYVELLKSRPDLCEVLLLLKDANREELSAAIRVLTALMNKN